MNNVHEAGGKVKSALPPGLQGDAEFSDCQRYRPILRRWLGPQFPERYVVFIGMNPSTATATANDPTITREWGFTVREQFTGYIKFNIADYRATFPKDLLAVNVSPRSPANLPAIRQHCKTAALTIICHGKLNPALAAFGAETITILLNDNVKLWCFGKNADGSPKHPLYLSKAAPLILF